MARFREEMETARKLMNGLKKTAMEEQFERYHPEMATAGDPEAIKAMTIGRCANTAGIDLMPSRQMPESHMSERYKNQ